MPKIIFTLLLMVAPPSKPERKPTHQEYVFLPVCVEQILVNTQKWHCLVDDPEHPKSIACDPESMTIMLKKGVKPSTCIEIHMVAGEKR